jgi:hypothetical protein
VRRGVKLGIGIPAALAGAVLTIAGLLLLGSLGFDGTLTTPRTSASTDAPAIVIAAELADDDLESIGAREPVTIDLESGAGEIFVGIAQADDVASYLEDVSFAEATEVRYPGGALTWDLEEGTWSLVVMNADGSPGVDVTGTLTARVPSLGIALAVGLAVGAALALTGTLLVVSALRMPVRPAGTQEGGLPLAAPTDGGVPPRPDA